VQVVFNPDLSPEALSVAEKIRSEYVLSINAKVVAREEGTINPNLKTGKIELQAEEVTILNEAKTPPFTIGVSGTSPQKYVLPNISVSSS